MTIFNTVIKSFKKNLPPKTNKNWITITLI